MSDQLTSADYVELGHELIGEIARALKSHRLRMPCEILVTGAEDDLVLLGKIVNDPNDEVLGFTLIDSNGGNTDSPQNAAYPLTVTLTDSVGTAFETTVTRKRVC